MSRVSAGLTAALGKVRAEGLDSATLIRTVVVPVMRAVIVTHRGERISPNPAAARPMIFLILPGLATGLSWLFPYRALQMAPVSLVAPPDKLSVVFAVLPGVIFLGEALTLKLVIGHLALVIAGAHPRPARACVIVPPQNARALQMGASFASCRA